MDEQEIKAAVAAQAAGSAPFVNRRDPARALGPDGLPARSRRAPKWADVPDEKWDDWRWQLSNRVNDLAEIERIFELTDEEREGLSVDGKFRVDVTPYFISLIDPKDPDDPIRRQVIPLGREQQAFTGMMEDFGVTLTTILETAWALRGLQRMLMDLVADPDLAKAILNIPYRYHLTAAKKLVEMGVDAIWVGDDIGAQHAMAISPELWRRIFKPMWAEFFSELRRLNARLKIIYHSDGVIDPIIPDMIEIGLDVLNPIQSGVHGSGQAQAGVRRQAMLLGID